MRQGQLALSHRAVELAARDETPDRGFNGNPVAILGAQFVEVERIDQQRSVGIVATPRSIAKDVISVEYAPLPSGEHEWKILRRSGAPGIEMHQPFKHAGHHKANFAVGMTDQ